jgi:hypothetical protein
MVDVRDSALQIDVRAVRRGATVFAVGSVLSLAGFAMTTRVLLDALRRYVRSMPVPPTELARHHAALARTAAIAGAAAWRQGGGAHLNGRTVDLTGTAARRDAGVSS